MTTALITHPACLNHVTPDGHPEQVARLQVVLDALSDIPLERLSAPMAADDDLKRCHPQSYIDRLRAALPSSGSRQLDADTHMSPGSLEAAYRAAGAVLLAVDKVLSGDVKNA
ncbi:MAG: histone deacetylase family protein, partial [Marivivens sp.]|nr:histone deacetylase family protein [Marivivens sp.]